MTLGLLGAIGAALCYGVASILQAMAARKTATAEGLDPRLMLRLARSWQYLLGLGLDGLAFVLSIAAVRTLPLFAVQAIVASFLAVTAVLGAIVLKMPLRRADKIGVGVVIIGLVMVGLSAGEDSPVEASSAELWGVLAATVVLAAVAFPAARLKGPKGAAVLGAVAGLAFGATSVAARMLPAEWSVLGVLTSPVSYALVLAGAVALLAYSTALQRASVTAATAPLVVAETVAPALVGVIMLGDRPQQGLTAVAIIGFCLAVAGALSLSRHGEVSADELPATTTTTTTGDDLPPPP